MRHLLVAAGGLVAGLLLAGTSVPSILPYLLVVVCPLMMMWSMRGHGDSRTGGDTGAMADNREPRNAGTVPR